MIKICHLRGNKNYWGSFNVFNHWKKLLSYSIYQQFNIYWNNLLNIPHMEFRKLIRELVINQIKKTEYFDIILEDNESCYEYFKNNSHEVILFQQDDDDVFIKPFENNIPIGFNVFPYSVIDPRQYIIQYNNSRTYNELSNRKKNHNIETYTQNNPLYYYKHASDDKIKGIQSNHAVINNKNNVINFDKFKIWDIGHSSYSKVIRENVNLLNKLDKKYTCQFYHLFSHSTWRGNEENNKEKTNKDNLSQDKFLTIVDSYINNLNTLDISIPLLIDFKKLYSELL